jgi:hypothetical protein
MIATGAIWAALAVAASTDVEITKPSGKRVAVTIAGHPETKEYRYEGEPKVGVSLAAVLKDVGIGDRAWTTITAEGLTVQNGSFANRKPPIFFMKRDDVAFYKPKSKDSPASQRTAQGQFFAMSFRVPLEVEASDNSPKAGQTVTYEAVVPDGGPQSAFEFRWVPSSGSPSTTDKFEYTYPETSGEVTINVTAKRVSDGEVVGTAATGETVEAPPASSGTGGTGTTGTGFGTGPSFGTDSYTPPSGDFDTNFPDVGDSSSDFPDAPKAPKTDITPTEEAGDGRVALGDGRAAPVLRGCGGAPSGRRGRRALRSHGGQRGSQGSERPRRPDREWNHRRPAGPGRGPRDGERAPASPTPPRPERAS